MDISALQQQLTQAGIDLTSWGTGEAKSVAHLQKEIEEGEAKLVTDEKGQLIRQVETVGADVYYKTKEGLRLHLKEEKQVFSDGRERQRSKRMGNAVSEKMKEGEDPTVALIRGVREELGLENITFTFKGTFENTSESQSYPGLVSRYRLHLFEVTLTDGQFNPEGYIEEQDNVKTYFVWENV